MSKPKAPRPPDPYQTAAADFAFNNPNQITPFGSLTTTAPTFTNTGTKRRPFYTQTGAGEVRLGLDPRLQQQFDRQLDVSNISLDEALRRQPELANLPDLPSTDPREYRQAFFDQMRGLLDPVFSDQERGLRDRLANQGLPATSEAYGHDTSLFLDGRNQAYERAARDAILQAPGLAAQEFQLGAARRAVPFNEIASLLGLQQTQVPTLQNFYSPRGTDFTGAQALSTQAATNNFQSQSGIFNNLMSGLFSLGGEAIKASDRRLKRDIAMIGKTPGGHNWYSFEYVWGERSEGVMADEVMHVPGAVIEGADGYLLVDYGRIS